MELLLFIATHNGLFQCEKDRSKWRVTGHFLMDHHVTCVTSSSGRVLVGTGDGIFYSDDRGVGWRESDSGPTHRHIRWIAHHPQDGSIVLAGTEPAAIFVTRDGGDNWFNCEEVEVLRDKHRWYLPYSPEAGCVRSFAFHEDRVYAAAEVGGILRSDDRGKTWFLVGEGKETVPPRGYNANDVHSVEVHRTSRDLITAATGGGLFRSADGGESWHNMYDCYCRAIWVDRNDPDHIVFSPATRKGWHGTIVESRDGGMSWETAAGGLDVPWPGKMIERFKQVGDELLAVRSDGRLFAASIENLEWKQILPEAEEVSSLAFLEK